MSIASSYVGWRALVWPLAVLATACGSSSSPGSMTGPGQQAVLMSVSPRGGASQVAVSTSITMTFSRAMGASMAQYVDLHQGDLSGPTVPISCAWSSGQVLLTCTPTQGLKPQTQYTIHMGAGLTDSSGHVVGMDPGLGMGGQWVMGTMMGGMHAGMAMGMLGADWRGTNGSYGMAFPFTTA